MYNFYTGIVPITELRNEEELSRFLQSSGKVFCLAEAKISSCLSDTRNDATQRSGHHTTSCGWTYDCSPIEPVK